MAYLPREIPPTPTPHRAIRAGLVLIAAVCSFWLWGQSLIAGAAGYPLEIIELRSRLPEDLIPILAPLAGPDGTVIGAQHSLFVRASPERLADIRRALVELDRPPRSLLIQVRQVEDSNRARSGVAARIDEPVGGGNTRIRVGPRGPGGSRVIASAGERGQQLALSQEVRALDGHPAFIAVGTDWPLPFRELDWGPYGPVVREGGVYRSARSGFSVVPRVLGDRVTLEIETQAASPAGRGALRSGSVGSRVEARLGEWVSIGVSAQSQQSERRGLIFGGSGRHETDSRVEIRVLPAD